MQRLWNRYTTEIIGRGLQEAVETYIAVSLLSRLQYLVLLDLTVIFAICILQWLLDEDLFAQSES